MTAGIGQITVALNAPSSNGGSTITGYQTTCTSTNGGLTGTTAFALTLAQTVTGLSNGKTYRCRVVAENTIGPGPASAASAAVTLPGVPGAPSITSATAGVGQIVVAFNPPASDGSETISGYQVTCTSTNGGVTGTTAFLPSSPITVTSLTNSVTYRCQVFAQNIIGTGPASAQSVAVKMPNVPGPPSITSATAGLGQIVVAFNPSASDGGSAITGYQATCTSTNGGLTGTSTFLPSSPLTVTGLTNAVTYRCRVVAQNIIGAGTHQPSPLR